MLQPKKTKYRKQQKGRMKGKAMRGATLAFGTFGLKAIESTWITEHKKTEEFENKIKELTGAKYALAVSNGTVGLFMSMKVLGIGKGDEVIVPDITFIASPNSVKMTGGTPIPVDVDKKTFNIDPEKIPF